MSQLNPAAIADSYNDALRIVRRAGDSVVHITALWDKARRVEKYLDAQATAELAEVLGE
jgi:hypothetical protein